MSATCFTEVCTEATESWKCVTKNRPGGRLTVKKVNWLHASNMSLFTKSMQERRNLSEDRVLSQFKNGINHLGCMILLKDTLRKGQEDRGQG